jgi:hypothetical protein
MKLRSKALSTCLQTILRVFIAGLAFILGSAHADTAPVPPNDRFYTRYSYVSGDTTISWITCGQSRTGMGCFGMGQIGPFRHPCAVAGSGGLVYVADSDNPVGELPANGMQIFVYAEVNSSKPSVTLLRALPVAFPPSSIAKCWMGVLGDQIYVGTDQTADFFIINNTTGETNSGQNCGTPTNNVYSNGHFVLIDQAPCFLAFSKTGAVGSGGSVGNSFFPSPSSSVPLN